MTPYRVFVSSPSDVQLERDRAEIVIKRLNSERFNRAPIEIVRWEHEFYRADRDFQAQIPAPADCHLVICIFWKRLGSDLPPQYARPDGTLPTGTEFEFESALHAAAERPEKLPDVLVYRKIAEVMFSAEKLELERAQYDRFMAFWQRWFRNEKGHFLAGFQSFEGLDDFETLFEQHLRSWLDDRESTVIWAKGSPFRGLEPFDIEHAPIFFGRRREIERARARLIASAMSGNPFLLITGASGSGKSSLARAGLIPRLGEIGGLSTLSATLRWTVLTPGQIAGNWAHGFAKLLFERTALGDELARGDFGTIDALERQLARSDTSSVLPLVRALSRVGEAIASAEQRVSGATATLFILIDQLEELFAWPRAQSEEFLRLLKLMCNSVGSHIWIVATMRSDFQHRLADYPTLEQLAGRIEVRGPGESERTLELPLPSMADLREMINNPIHAAGLKFETSQDGLRDLGQIIEVEARPETMPAVQFLLSELYARRSGNTLTLDAFDNLCGVAGVMAQRGEELYQAIDSSARQAFPRIVRSLVAQVRSDVPATIRRVAEQTFATDDAASRMIKAMKDARLVISDYGEVHFAHDSILEGWRRLKEQIAEEHRLFEARDRLEVLCRQWLEGDKSRPRPRKLLLQGFPLAEGRELLAKWGANSLMDRQPELPAFIRASHVREKRTRRFMQTVSWIVAAVFAGLSWQWYDNWIAAERARKEAQAALWVASSRTDLRDGRIAQAIEDADKAFVEVPSEASRSALAAALYETSPHQVAKFEGGPQAGGAITWASGDTLAYVNANSERVQILPLLQRSANGNLRTWLVPPLTHEQDGKRATIRTMRLLASQSMMMVLDDGTVAIVSPGQNIPRIFRATAPTTLFPTESAAAIGNTGALSAIATVSGQIEIIKCDVTAEDLASGCNRHQLLDVHGRVAAISPDEKRVAVGDEAGNVAIFDRDGRSISPLVFVGGSLISLAWSESRDWIAAGNANGDVVIIDTEDLHAHTIAKTSIPGYPITGMQWRPNSTELAFSCNKVSVCLWPLTPASIVAGSTDPARLLVGQTNPVLRLAWSPFGNYLVSLSSEGTIRLWSDSQNTDVSFALYAENSVRQTTVASSIDGRWLAAGADDGTVRIWDVASMELRRTAKLDGLGEIASLSWNGSGLLAAVGDRSGLAVIPADTAQPVRMLPIGSDATSTIAWVDDNTIALPQQADSCVALVDVANRQLRIKKCLNELGAPFAMAVGNGGKTVFAAYTDPVVEITVRDLVSKSSVVITSNNSRGAVGSGSLSVSLDGRWLAASGGDAFVAVYNIADPKNSLLPLPLNSTTPNLVAFSPSGSKLAALCDDGQLYIWSVDEKQFILFSIFKAIPGRASVIDGQVANTRGFSWVGNDYIAVAAGTSAINLIGLNPLKWRHRTKAVE